LKTYLATLMIAFAAAGCGGGDGVGTGTGNPTNGAPGAANGAGPSLFPTAVYTGLDETGAFKVPIAVNGATGVKWTSSNPAIGTVSGDDVLIPSLSCMGANL
jgi:hypothetical protein